MEVRRGLSDPLELELWAALWGLGTEPRSSTRVTGVLTTEQSVQPLHSFSTRQNKILSIHTTHIARQARLTFSVHFFSFVLLCCLFFSPTELKLYYKCIFFLSPHLIGTLEITKLRSAKHFLSICRLEAQRSRISLLTETGRVPGGRDGCRTLGELGKIQTRRTECWWHRPAIPELGRLARIVVNSRASWATEWDPPGLRQTNKAWGGDSVGKNTHWVMAELSSNLQHHVESLVCFWCHVVGVNTVCVHICACMYVCMCTWGGGGQESHWGFLASSPAPGSFSPVVLIFLTLQQQPFNMVLRLWWAPVIKLFLLLLSKCNLC